MPGPGPASEHACARRTRTAALRSADGDRVSYGRGPAREGWVVCHGGETGRGVAAEQGARRQQPCGLQHTAYSAAAVNRRWTHAVRAGRVPPPDRGGQGRCSVAIWAMEQKSALDAPVVASSRRRPATTSVMRAPEWVGREATNQPWTISQHPALGQLRLAAKAAKAAAQGGQPSAKVAGAVLVSS